MNTLIAKPIIKNQYWVVVDGKNKVGNVIANDTGYELKIGPTKTYFDSAKDLQKETKIQFQSIRPSAEVLTTDLPIPDKAFNAVYDVQRKIHLFTTTQKSKCYHAAGWFVVTQGSSKSLIKYPKYILLQRYHYDGPYKTEADAAINI